LFWIKLHSKILLIALSNLLCLQVFSQDTEQPYSKMENLVGLNFNTNGGFLGGVMGQVGIKKADRSYHAIGLEIVNVKHHREIKVNSVITGNSFIFGKQNYLFSIRPHYGVQWVCFPATRDDGVQVNLNLSGGFSIGLVKPYYIKYDYSRSNNLSLIREEPFDPALHRDGNKIVGHGNSLRGFGDSKITPGLHLKGSVLFYFGNYGRRISGLEAGGLVEGFFHKGTNGLDVNRVNIIPFTQNKWLFTSLYLNIFFGWRN